MEVNPSQSEGFCGLPRSAQPLPLNGQAPLGEAESVTHIQRDYLGEVYRLAEAGDGPVTTTALAARLEVSPPAVVRMMQRLAHEGYLRRVPYKGVVLTPAGEVEALRAIRRHRLLEAFLVSVMGYGWDEAHEPAHQLQAAIDEGFEDRMERVAGYPRYCPHGEPIPTRDGRIESLTDAPLTDAEPGQPLTVRRVKTHDPEKLRYLAQLGLTPGAAVQVLHRAPFNGPLRLRLGRTEAVIGHELAREVRAQA